jgi:hypothetical protein
MENWIDVKERVLKMSDSEFDDFIKIPVPIIITEAFGYYDKNPKFYQNALDSVKRGVSKCVVSYYKKIIRGNPSL